MKTDEQRVEAGVARWLLEHRQEILQSTGKHLEAVEEIRREVA